MVRLDKLVAQGFLLTRSEARAAIRRGRVRVEGQAALDPAAQVASGAALLLDGQAPACGARIYLMLNKPAGYLSATEDSRDPTVLDLLPQELRRVGLGVCGRLDKDSEGLLLLTNDGDMNHRLTAPRHHAQKVYQVRLDAPAGEETVAAFGSGIDLGDFVTAPAQLALLEDGTLCRVTLEEGKYHQIKRMFGRCGLHVVHLERIAMAGLPLDPQLPRGAFRPLNAGEIAALETILGRITKKNENK